MEQEFRIRELESRLAKSEKKIQQLVSEGSGQSEGEVASLIDAECDAQPTVVAKDKTEGERVVDRVGIGSIPR